MSRRTTWLVLAALAAGLLLGALLADAPGRQSWISAAAIGGGLWLDALKMTVLPLIVALLVKGIVGGAVAAGAGRTAALSVAAFMILYILSSLLGALATPLLLSVWPIPEVAATAFRSGIAALGQGSVAVTGTGDVLHSFVPDNVFKAAAAGEMLKVVFFTMLFGLAITRLSETFRNAIVPLFDAIAAAMLVVVGWVIAVAPIGIFFLSFAMGAGGGLGVIGAVAHYFLLYMSLGVVLLIAGYVLAVVAARWPLRRFARALAPVQAIAFSTQSSTACLPAMLVAARQLDVRERNADVTLPLAAALFRVTGPAMNLGVVIYLATLLGAPISIGAMIAGFAVASVMTIGSPGIPGQASFITTIAPIAAVMGVPVAPLAIFVALEPVPDMLRTIANVTVDVAVAGAVDRHLAPES
ncbi:MAG TPA: cation:dicarboxylase symporter family transporter [Sphingomicrobium sp.]|nr:cation:dicarboxylase symporter family transporter [Sphingomicrobium sp.]